MRVLFLPWGQTSHMFHLVPLAWAFRAGGHEVRVAAQAGSAAAAARAGLTVTRLGRSHDLAADTQRVDQGIRRELAALRARYQRQDRAPVSLAQLGSLAAVGPSPERSEAAPEPLARAAEAMAGDLVRLVRSWRPDLVIADPMVMAAQLAAAAAGCPLVHHLWGPAVYRTMNRGLPGGGLPVELWPDGLRRLFDQYAVTPTAEPIAGTIDTCPAALQYPNLPHRIPMRYVPYNGSGEAPDWLLTPPDRPRVGVTWGILNGDVAGADTFLVPRVLDALRPLGVEVVVAVGAAERARLTDPPPGVRVAADLPLHLLLPTCAAIVHQGGGGTMLTAATFGVPQATIPVMTGHQLSARRLAGTGAAVLLDFAAATTPAIRDAVRRALAEPVVAAAGRLRDEIAAQPTPAEVVRILAGRL